MSEPSSKVSLKYRGRFAPSPTGPLHFGSLVCAVASYLQARSKGGEWLVRMENIDPPREPQGAADDILRTLERYGLLWDHEVLYQSARSQAYEEVLLYLHKEKLLYRCACSRKQIREASRQKQNTVYPETCRNGLSKNQKRYALRIKTQNQPIGVEDIIQGPYRQNLREQVGDFVIKRIDGLYAYQLAVVVDDAEQGITEIVRGSDLLDNTPRQIYLQQLLKYPQPDYLHIPIATKNGEKLSKQTFAKAIGRANTLTTSAQALQFLGQKLPDQWQWATQEELWQWAIQHWDIHAIPRAFSRKYDVCVNESD